MRQRHVREVALSGVLVAALVAVWAVVLVPRWVRRYDSAADTDGSATMPGARVVVRPQHERPAGLRSRPVVPPAPAQGVTAVRRRRGIFAVLVLALLLTVVGAGLGALPVGIAVLPALSLGGYVVAVRRAATRAAVLRAHRRAELSRRLAGFRDFADPVPVATVGSAAVAAGYPGSSPIPSPPAVAPAGPGVVELPAGVVPGGRDASVAAASPSARDNALAGSGTWTPVRLPLPSYVTAPPAPAVVDGDWHEEDLIEGDLPGSAAAYALGDDVVQRRRAVGD